MRFTLLIAMLAAASSAFAVTYTYTAEVTKSADASTIGMAKAFGIAPVQSILTEVTFDVGFPEESPGMFDISITSFKQTTYGEDREKGYRNEENLEGVWPGKTFTLDIFALNDDGFIRDPTMALDSEYFDYNLVAFMLAPSEISMGSDVSATGSISRNCIRSTAIDEEASIDAEGNITVNCVLTQDSKAVKMTGSVGYEGTLTATMGDDGLPDTAEMTLEGVQNRLITIFGGENALVDNISMKITLVRETGNSE